MTKRIKPFDTEHGWWCAVFLLPVDLPFMWVEENTFINFKGYNLLLTPSVDKLYPAVYINTKMRHSFVIPEEPVNIILEFLSAFAWISEQRFVIHDTCAASYLIKRGNCEQYVHPYKHFLFEDIPEIMDEKGKLALALYREAQSMLHPAYQFLGFYKIINLMIKNGQKQIDWINANIHRVEEQSAKERLKELQKTETNIGKYLYVACRCAISHATVGQTIVNPDDYSDYRRLYRDVFLVKELARSIIRQDLGVQSRHDMYKSHLYELAGFKTLFPKIVVDKLTMGEKIKVRDFPKLPNLSIRLTGHSQFELLENLNAEVCDCVKNVLVIQCYSNEKLFKTRLFLNFAEERLQSDWMSPENVFLCDDGTPESCDRIIDFLEFRKNYLLNGILEVWDYDNQELLGHCDAFMPVNCIVNLDWFNAEFKKLSKMKTERIHKMS